MEFNMELIFDPIENPHISRSKHIDQVLEMYYHHFRKNDRPCTFDELVTYANWLGLKNKIPTKEELMNFLLDKRIAF